MSASGGLYRAGTARATVLVRHLADSRYRSRQVIFKGITGTVQGIAATAAAAIGPLGNSAPAAGPQQLYLIDAAGNDHHLDFEADDVATLLD